MWKKTFSYSFFVFLTATLAVFCLSISETYAFSCNELSEVDVNSASQEELECLQGIGPTYSERIVENRPFSSLDDLKRVSGIGPATVENIKEQGLATVGEGDTVKEGGDDEKGAEEGEKEEENGEITTRTRTVSGHSSPVELSTYDEISTVKIGAGRDRLASVESEVRFKAYVSDEESLPRNVYFEWVLGDGSVKRGREVEHRYYASGRYSVILTVRWRDQEVVSRAEVEVIEPEISIVSADRDLVTLRNSAEGEVNLGDWEIEASGGRFTIPDNTMIQPGSEISLPSQVTGLEIGEDGKVSIRSSEGGFRDSLTLGREMSVDSTTEALQESGGDVETVTVEDLKVENERLRYEVSGLRGEVTRLANLHRASQSDPVSDSDGPPAEGEGVVAEDVPVSDQGVNPDVLDGADEGESMVETVYDGSGSGGGLWKKLLSTPSAVFGRLPF